MLNRTFKEMPSREEILEQFTYDREQGTLRRKGKEKSHGQFRATKSQMNFSYLKANINGFNYRVHRLIYFIEHGSLPNGYVIDHIDGNTRNNHISNLRLATFQENALNRRPKNANT